MILAQCFTHSKYRINVTYYADQNKLKLQNTRFLPYVTFLLKWHTFLDLLRDYKENNVATWPI